MTQAAQVSPDARALLVQQESAVRMLSLEGMSGRELWSRTGMSPISAFPFSADSRTVVLEPSNAEVALFEVATGRELRLMVVRNHAFKEPRFAARLGGGENVLMNTALATVVLDPADGKAIAKLPLWGANVVRGGALAVGGRQSDFWRIDIATGYQETVDVIGSSRVALADPTGRWALMADTSSSIRVRDLEQGERGWLHGHHDVVRTLHATNDGRWAFSRNVSEGKWWDLNAIGDHRAAPRTYDSVTNSAIAEDGSRLVTLGWGSVRVYDAGRGQLIWTRVPGGRDSAASAAFSADHSRLLVAGWEGVAVAYDAASGEQLWRKMFPDTTIRAAAWSGDGREVMIGDLEGRLRVLDAATGGHRSLEEGLRPVLALARVPSGAAGSAARRMVAVLGAERADGPAKGGGDGLLVESNWGTLRSAETLAPLESAAGMAGSATVSRDGRWVFGTRLPSAVVLVDRTSKRVWNIVDDIGVGARGGAFDPGSRRLAMACTDGLVRIVEPAMREETLALAPGCGALAAVWFGADQLIASGSGMPLVVFDAAPRPPTTARWRLAQRARELIDPMFDELTFSERVVRRIEQTTGLDAELRECAIASALGRGNHFNQLNSFAWEIVRFPGRALDEVEVAIEAAEICHQGSPDRFGPANTVGVAYYRAARHEDAIEVLRLSERLGEASGRGPHPLNFGFIALAAARLGRMQEARSAWATALDLSSGAEYAGDVEVAAMLAEGATLFGAGSTGGGSQ